MALFFMMYKRTSSVSLTMVSSNDCNTTTPDATAAAGRRPQLGEKNDLQELLGGKFARLAGADRRGEELTGAALSDVRDPGHS